ncbi:LysE family translocator [Trinickia caryophylli]|uniref:Threonine/homoserine/homoserine lactone efflux protein n=1 Tax=Trinickia caryophylli TaxID=28094 RepID=A0A1X7E9A2_TRICW|nr:LysE family translocator [Trinickia caryophylli]PMS13014.1 LysE family translocator [Trinickia caryophylli]TRX14776.1 LysE family translocator [Trinickia caryophylli]WQE14622.1 LysE family translocator [Trinickia caryophylli]SMF29684.1 Threonine/homoserine/homoserine lactone efflux protein [Trinickia caryophylli]GLU31961.1 LysE family translocator [Trinickia caryophylli]
MVSVELLLAFVAALAVVYAIPGPDMALVVQTSIAGGTRRGLAAAGGLAVARATHVVLSACGVAALLKAAPWLYEIVRYGGAAYLAYVAVQIFRSPLFALPDAAQTGQAVPSPLRAAFVKGMFTNLLNPKALLFCSVLLPQFVRPSAGSIGSQVSELGAALVAFGMLFDICYAAGAARISTLIRKHPRAQTLQRWGFSAALLGFALRLSFD